MSEEIKIKNYRFRLIWSNFGGVEGIYQIYENDKLIYENSTLAEAGNHYGYINVWGDSWEEVMETLIKFLKEEPDWVDRYYDPGLGGTIISI